MSLQKAIDVLDPYLGLKEGPGPSNNQRIIQMAHDAGFTDYSSGQRSMVRRPCRIRHEEGWLLNRGPDALGAGRKEVGPGNLKACPRLRGCVQEV
jgi:hypothetical protein